MAVNELFKLPPRKLSNGSGAPLSDYASPHLRLPASRPGCGVPVQRPAPTPAEDTNGILREIRESISCLCCGLETLPERDTLEKQKRWQIAPREREALLLPGGSLGADAASKTTVISYEFKEKMCGKIERIGVQSNTTLSLIKWTLKLDGMPYTTFSNLQFYYSCIDNPLEFPVEIVQGTLVELEAENTSDGEVDLYAVMTGWREYLAPFKKYGDTRNS